MDIIQAMKERRSVRSYSPTPLDEEMKNRLQESIDNSYTLFGGKLTMRIKTFDIEGDYRPSTYGVIKGASEFFLLGVGEDEDSALTAGFQFEQVVLKAWQLGLGTCWIAGTFKGSQFDRDENWPEGENLKIISPVGFPEKQRFMEKMMRSTLGSNNRKPFAKLFFEDDFRRQLDPKNKFGEALEMLRLAPSSTNSQPWRVLVDGDTVRFYCKSKGPVSIVDSGIGICHFYETEKFNGFDGKFEKETDYPIAPDNWKYIVTYTRSAEA